MATPTPFTKKVITIIRKIPRGSVATYGQVARLAGKPLGSRGVSWILHSISVAQDLPWHRVINGKGRISFPELSEAYQRQKLRLENEGVTFDDAGRLDLTLYQWKKG